MRREALSESVWLAWLAGWVMLISNPGVRCKGGFGGREQAVTLIGGAGAPRNRLLGQEERMHEGFPRFTAV